MAYNINYDDLRNMYEKAITGTSLWQGLFANVTESLNGIISDEDFAGEGADAVKEYLLNVHVFTMTAIEAMISEFNSKIVLYADGLYNYDEDMYAKINEDYLTTLIGSIDNMITYAGEVHQHVQGQVNGVSSLVSCDLKSLQTYTTSLSERKQNLSSFRDNIGEHDANYAGANLENLRTLAQNTYDLVQRVHEAGTINVSEVDYSYYFELDNFQEMIGQINSSINYSKDNYDKVNESEEHLRNVRIEIQEEAEREAKQQRITNGVILVGGCVIALASVVVTCGADAPLVVTVLGGVVAVDSVSKGIEGGQDIYYGITGEMDSTSYNLIRDSVFQGNQTTYDVSMIIVNGVYGFSGSMNTISSAGSFASAECITAVKVESFNTAGGLVVDQVGTYISDNSNMGVLGTFITETTFSLAGNAVVSGAGGVLDTKLYSRSSTNFYYDDRTSFHLNSVLFENSVDIHNAAIPIVEPASITAIRTPNSLNSRPTEAGNTDVHITTNLDGVKQR